MPTPTHEPDALKLQRLTPREMAPVVASPTEQSKAEEKVRDLEPPPPLVLRVALRPGRVTTLTPFSIGSIIAIVLYFHEGHELQRFDKSSKTPQEQNRLLDLYNSYAGNIAAVFGKPIEMFVTAAVQVLMLRFLTRFLLRPDPDYRVALVTLALTAGVGYLIGNAFNALNVQLRDLEIEPSILSSDLSADSDAVAAVYSGMASDIHHSISEMNPKNPISNTILRNLVLPREPKRLPKCNWIGSQSDFPAYVPDDVLEFGMPQREWMKKMLPEALEPERLRLLVNPTQKNANDKVQSSDLPMDASRAANLLLHSLLLSAQFVPWGVYGDWDKAGWIKKSGVPSSLLDGRLVPTAKALGLLSSDTRANETQQRKWFLEKSPLLVGNATVNDSLNMSSSDIGMEFTHIQLSPSIELDAVTFEIDVHPKLLTDSVNKMSKDRYFNLYPAQCAPWPGRCLIQKSDQPPPLGKYLPWQYDAPPQIQAFAMCIDENGSETLQSHVSDPKNLVSFGVQTCANVSKSSLLVVSVAKRLVADALMENFTGNATGLYEDPYSSVAVNLRKIYSFTVARLGWSLQNISASYSARCESKNGDCRGLTFGLTGANGSSTQQLVVGAASLPIGLLSPPYLTSISTQRPLTLVHVTEPPRQHSDHRYDKVAGDLLLQHNVKNFTWAMDRQADPSVCNAFIEDRLQLVLNNHIYMETTLQATYTSAMFFLFQDAVVRDVVKLIGGAETLRFDGNVHKVAVWLSIPRENTVLTLAGCGGLFGALAVAMVWSLYNRYVEKEDPLAKVTNPHVIARAMLDESQFPSLLLHRRVMETSDGYQQRSASAFVIESMTIQHVTDIDHRVAASV